MAKIEGRTLTAWQLTWRLTGDEADTIAYYDGLDDIFAKLKERSAEEIVKADLRPLSLVLSVAEAGQG